MRGLCEESNIDTYYTPKNKEKEGQTVFYGLAGTIIEYHQEDLLWHMSVLGSEENTTATSNSSMHSFLLGSSEWTVYNDYNGCNQGKPYKIQLKLSGCQEDQFTCNNGECISMEKRCNQINNCMDKSDERMCSVLSMEDGYNNMIPPFTFNEDTGELKPAKVNVSMSLLNVIEISEVNHIIELKYQVKMEWYENRVSYHNLKKEDAQNTLSSAELHSLWIPYIIFQNTDDNEAITIDNIRSTAFITQESEFTRQ